MELIQQSWITTFVTARDFPRRDLGLTDQWSGQTADVEDVEDDGSEE